MSEIKRSGPGFCEYTDGYVSTWGERVWVAWDERPERVVETSWSKAPSAALPSRLD